MKRFLSLSACVALACLASSHADAAHFKTQPGHADINRTLAAQTRTPGVDTGYCIKRAPKTATRGSAYLLFCYGDPSAAYEFYTDNSGHNSDDADSTTYEQASDGTVLYSR